MLTEAFLPRRAHLGSGQGAWMMNLRISSVVLLLAASCGPGSSAPTPGPEGRQAAVAPSFPAIKHVVVLMMENRSFDHFLGWLPGADGKQAGLAYPDAAGALHPTHMLAPDYQGCLFRDP